MREAGVRGLRSTPIYSRDLELIGVVSTQYAEPRPPARGRPRFSGFPAGPRRPLRRAAVVASRPGGRKSVRPTRCSPAWIPTLHGGVSPGGKSVRRVLVVDDNEDAANMLGELLEDAGHEVRTAYTGIEALRAAETFRPDVVLLDIGLPDMDGYEVARRLRGRAGAGGQDRGADRLGSAARGASIGGGRDRRSPGQAGQLAGDRRRHRFGRAARSRRSVRARGIR